MSEQSRGESIGRLYGLGVGPGDPELITVKAQRILQRVQVVFHVTGPNSAASISGRIVDSVPGCHARRVELVFSMARHTADRKPAWEQNAQRVAAELRNGCDCAFVTIGDPLIYSTFTYLLREVRALLPQVSVETVPGITSYQQAAAVQNLPLAEGGQTLTIEPAPDHREHPCGESRRADCTVLLKTGRDHTALLQSIDKDDTVLYAARLGCVDQVVTMDRRRIASLQPHYMSLMIAKRNRTDGVDQ